MTLNSRIDVAEGVFTSATCYLPLAMDMVPALKKGMVPLSALPWSVLPWLTATEQRSHLEISEEDYQQYLLVAYQRLPANLAGLLSFEQFVQQAAHKRAQIEEELRQHRVASVPQSSPQDWFVQRVFSDPYSMPAWQQAAWAFASIWLAIDERAWPQAELQDVLYGVAPPSAYPQRIYYDPEGNQALSERRLVLNRSQVNRVIRVHDHDWALLRLPPNAIRGVLLGSEITPSARTAFVQFWRSDFRYQRIPLLSMVWKNAQIHWDRVA